MGRTSAATSAVKAVLDELAEVISQPIPSRSGWDADLEAIQSTWARLKRCLHEAAELIKKPQTGHGLESVWLHECPEFVARVEEVVR